MKHSEYHSTSTEYRLSPRVVRRGLRTCIVSGLMGMSVFAVALGMPLGLFLKALGASGVLIGFVTTLPTLGMLVQIPSVWLVDKLAHRRAFWAWTTMFSRVVFFLPAFAVILVPDQPKLALSLLVGAMVVFGFSSQASAVPWLSWMADLVPENRRGSFWGTRQMFLMIAFLFFSGLSGVVLDRFPSDRLEGFGWLFAMVALLGCGEVILHSTVPEPAVPRNSGGQAFLVRLLLPFKQPDFLAFTLAMAAWMFALGVIGQFGNLYLRETLGLPYIQLAALQIAYSLGSVTAGFASTLILDRVGSRTFAAVLAALLPLLHLVWFFVHGGPSGLPVPGLTNMPQATLLLCLTNFMAGFIVAGVAMSQMSMNAALTKDGDRTIALAAHCTLVGLVTTIGPVLGGWIMDHTPAFCSRLTTPVGLPFSYIHLIVMLSMVTVWAVAVPLFLRIKPVQHELPFRQALRHVALVSPARLARDLYNLHLVQSPASSDRRAGAVRGLGSSGSPIVVVDLIEQLDDAAAEVREAAVFALGGMAHPEALQALLTKLEDPYSDLGPHIARALRHTHSAASVDPLVRKLHEPDRETQSESARTLGVIGDKRASASLLELLKETREDKVLAASSEALACLGEWAALYEILPRFRSSSNPVLRRSLAVAMGDLLGERGVFYRLLNDELRNPGVSVEKLCILLRRRMRALKNDQVGPLVTRRLEQLESAYEHEEYLQVLNEALTAASSLVALTYGIEFGPEARATAQELIWRNQQLGLSIWLLNALLEPVESGPAPAQLEALLGIFALAQWRPLPPPDRDQGKGQGND